MDNNPKCKVNTLARYMSFRPYNITPPTNTSYDVAFIITIQT